MSKFDFMGFGSDSYHYDYFVANAKKHTAAEAVEICKREFDYKFSHDGLREPTLADVEDAHCAFRFGAYSEWPCGCYTFVPPDGRSAFPVHVICFDKLKLEGIK